MKTFISLGAGVQSSVLAMMCDRGELPYKIDAAIFADVQCEPPEVYEYLAYLKSVLTFPVHVVTAGNLESETFRQRTNKKTGNKYGKNYIPSYTINPDGTNGHMMRKCTYDFKLMPLLKAQRRLAEVKRGEKNIVAQSLIGISKDEAQRMKDSREPWIRNVYPLVDAGITRADCLKWAAEKGIPTPPRSACYFCPYHSNREWNRLKTEEPELFDKACAFEARLQATNVMRNVKGKEFLHNSRVPLNQVEFENDSQLNLFGNECEGLCGN